MRDCCCSQCSLPHSRDAHHDSLDTPGLHPHPAQAAEHEEAGVWQGQAQVSDDWWHRLLHADHTCIWSTNNSIDLTDNFIGKMQLIFWYDPQLFWTILKQSMSDSLLLFLLCLRCQYAKSSGFSFTRGLNNFYEEESNMMAAAVNMAYDLTTHTSCRQR